MLKIIKWENSAWLPIVVASLMFTGVLVSYIWAVVRDDVEAFLPFISDAGGSPPQSGIFAIFLFLSSVAGLVTVVVRYYSVKALSLDHKGARYLNIFSMFLGFVCICGIIVVASYPVNSKPKTTDHDWRKDVLLPHTVGAFMIFSIGVFYALTQAICSFLLRKSLQLTSKPMFILLLRAFLVLAAFVAFIVMITVSRLASDSSPANSTEITTPQYTSPSTSTLKMFAMKAPTPTSDDTVWTSDPTKLPSIVAEWVLAFSLFAFFATMFVEMRGIGVEIRIARSNEISLLEERSSTLHSSGSVAY